MTIFEVTKENVENLPLIKWNEETDETFDGVLIVPTGEVHESGYGCMQFIFCHGEEAVKRVCRGSDVLHIDGIGGYGEYNDRWAFGVPQNLPVRWWRIDCTPNGFLRLFTSKHEIKPGDGLSDFSIYAVDDEKEIKNDKT